MINWTLKVIPISKLKNHPKNPRKISKDQAHHLQNLIETFGFIEKPIVNLDHTIIGGHQRVKILKKLKIKEVDCWIPDRQLSEEDINHLCIGLNLNQGSFDYDILSNEWNQLDLLKYGFNEQQLMESCKEKGEALLSEEKPKSGKKKVNECPACGHQF